MSTAHLSGGMRQHQERHSVHMTVERVPLAECAGWTFHDGAISHVSGGFFDVGGLLSAGAADERVVFHQRQSALTGLILSRGTSDISVLVQMRQEPGNLLGAQLAPTIQSTPANYLAVHGGRRSEYVDAFTRHSLSFATLSDSYQFDLARRYYRKSKRAVVLDAIETIPAEPGFLWLSGLELAAMVTESALVNADLRTLLALAPWSANPASGLVPVSGAVRDSLVHELRREALAPIFTGPNRAESEPLHPVSLDRLTDWQMTDDAIVNLNHADGPEVRYYRVHAPDREVSHWCQPLLWVSGEGEVTLAHRDNGGLFEVAVRVVVDPTLGGPVLLPTKVRYPEDAPPDDCQLSTTTSPTGRLSTLECDEGGRFLENASRYRVVPIEDLEHTIRTEELIWLSISELKWALSRSLLASMQLRVISSHLLGLET